MYHDLDMHGNDPRNVDNFGGHRINATGPTVSDPGLMNSSYGGPARKNVGHMCGQGMSPPHVPAYFCRALQSKAPPKDVEAPCGMVPILLV